MEKVDMKKVKENIIKICTDALKRHKLPVDKYGNYFAISGGTIDDVKVPQYGEMTLVTALNLIQVEKLDKIIKLLEVI